MGWKPKKMLTDLDAVAKGDPPEEQNDQEQLYTAEVIRGRLIPREKIFARIKP